MFTKYAAALAIGAAIAVSATPAAAATFNTTDNGANLGTVLTYTSGGVTYEWFQSATVDGISFTAYGYSTANAQASTLPELARLQRWDKGLGVLNATEGNGSDGQHTIDNSSRYDFVALVFNKSVQLTGMTLNAFLVDGKGPDKDAWVGYAAAPSGSTMDSIWPTLLGSSMSAMDGVLPNTAGKYGNVWVIGADRTIVTANRNDGFKLGAVSAVVQPTAPVPEPATWATMMLGFGLAGAAMRRRRTGVAFA